MMTPELTALGLAGLLQVVQIGIYAVAAQKQVGRRYAASPRDEGRQLSGKAGRLQRAMHNHFEGMILFTIAVVVVTMAGKTGPFTATCAWVYLIARVAYVPAYARGWVPWRSVIWGIGFLSTVAMMIAGLVP